MKTLSPAILAKIMRCPFCGGHDFEIIGDKATRHYDVLCDGCGAMGPGDASPALAIERWNTRQSSASAPELFLN